MHLLKATKAKALAFCLGLFGVTSAPAQLTVVPCTQDDLLTAVAEASQNNGGRITFDCQNTTILMDRGFDYIDSNVIIDGEGNNITLEYAGPFIGCTNTGQSCSAVGPSGDAECGGGSGSCRACNQGDNFGIGALNGPPIAYLQGSGNSFRNLKFLNWLESLQILGPSNTITNNEFEGHYCSDDGLSTPSDNATNTLIKDNKFLIYYDKALQADRGEVTIDGNLFENTRQPIRINNAADPIVPGRFTIINNIFTWTEDVFLFNESPISNCDGPRFTSAAVIRFDNNIVDCLRGLRLGNPGALSDRVEITLDGNTFIPHGGFHENRVGVRIAGSVVASLSNNLVNDNGRNSATLPSGGVVVMDSAQVDLGGGSLMIGGVATSSPGGNTIVGNFSDNEENGKDVRNFRPSFQLKAENNCWDGQTLAQIANDVDDVNDGPSYGPVDFNPFAATCNSGTRLGPTVTPISPTDDQNCVLENPDINILVSDFEDSVDQSSISVEVNGNFVSPAITGSGGSITLSLPPPAFVPPSGIVAVEVIASDTASPPNTTTKSYSFCIRPPRVEGVSVDPLAAEERTFGDRSTPSTAD